MIEESHSAYLNGISSGVASFEGTPGERLYEIWSVYHGILRQLKRVIQWLGPIVDLVRGKIYQYDW